MGILNFSEWITNESFYNEDTNHFPERFQQRLLDASSVILPSALKDILGKKFPELQVRSIKQKYLEEFKKEIETRKNDLLRKDFYGATQCSGYPFISLYMRIDDKEYPVEVYSKYYDSKKARDMESVANRFYVPILNNELKTILGYQSSEENEEKKMIDHLIRYNIIKDPMAFKVGTNSDFKFVLDISNDGTVYKKQREYVDKKYYTNDQQYNLGEGRKLKVQSKLGSDGYLEVTVEKVENKMGPAGKVWLKDGAPVLFLNAIHPETNNPIKLRKQMTPGTYLQLPIAENGGYVLCKVFEPGYILDQRQKEPVNLKYRAVLN